MTIAGIIILLIIVTRILKCRNYEKNLFFFFTMTIIVNVFINIGYGFSYMPSLSLGEILMILCVFYGFYGTKGFKVKQILSAIILLGCTLIGNINIYYNSSEALIVSWRNTSIDYVLYGFEAAVNPVFGQTNINSMIWLLIFIVFCFNNAKFLSDKLYVEKLCEILLKAFHIYIILLSIEAVVSNLSSGIAARSLINYVFGVSSETCTYTIAPYRYGFYCIYGFYVEPSYMASMIIYGCLLYRMNKITNKEIIYVLMCIICLIFTGSSAAYMVIPFIILIVLYVNVYTKVNRAAKIILCIGCLVIFSIIAYWLLSRYMVSKSSDKILDKIVVYLLGADTGINSGYTRNNGNALCYNVLKYNPIFGVGLGTTRGYGFIPGAVACLGILGLSSLGYFYIQMFNIALKKNAIILIVIILYLTSIFSVWYIYSPMMIALFISFNKNCAERMKDI